VRLDRLGITDQDIAEQVGDLSMAAKGVFALVEMDKAKT
jgi:hypothetical protein